MTRDHTCAMAKHLGARSNNQAKFSVLIGSVSKGTGDVTRPETKETKAIHAKRKPQPRIGTGYLATCAMKILL